MGGEQAANVLAEVKVNQMKRSGEAIDRALIAQVREETLAAFQEQLSAYYWRHGVLPESLGMTTAVSDEPKPS